MALDANGKASHGDGGALLPFLSLLCAQLLASSWHVLGKHVMAQVPYLAPISYVLLRTLISSVLLLVVGNLYEGRVPFPPLFRDDRSARRELGLEAGLLKPSSPGAFSSSASIASGNSVGLSLSKPSSSNSLNGVFSGGNKNGDLQPFPPKQKQHRHHHRPRRKKVRRPTLKNYAAIAIRSMIPSLGMVLRNIIFMFKVYQQQINNMNPDAVQIISAGLSGMLLLPICYTTGLILTSPTVASVWDGPMIPLGCFCTAVTLGLEKMSKSRPVGQIGSLLLAVGGSIVVLLVDYMGGGHGIGGGTEVSSNDAGSSSGGFNDHMQFIRGNMVLAGVVAAYSATALLQKRLNHYPPVTLTGWMFGIAFLGCFALLAFDSILGSRITGCTLGQALIQLYIALTTSPTFRYGLFYAAFFVSAVTMAIMSYASSHLESSVITLFAATQPPLTAVLEWIWEGKELGWAKLGGMACVGLGMWFFTYIKRVEKDATIKGNQANKELERRFENGSVDVLVTHSNGENHSRNGKGRSPNLTNRKVVHADV